MPVNVGEAVKERILQLCKEENLSVNKLSSMSGVTQSTVNNIVSGRNHSTTLSTIKNCATAWASPLRNFFIANCFVIWSRKLNNSKKDAVRQYSVLFV